MSLLKWIVLGNKVDETSRRHCFTLEETLWSKQAQKVGRDGADRQRQLFVSNLSIKLVAAL